jgi:hypothetical protein
LDEILNRIVEEGVSTVNIEHVKGAPQAPDFVPITDLFETIHKQAANKELDYDSLTGSRSIHAPQCHVATLDDDDESDLRVVKLGRTDHAVARSFACAHEISTKLE